MGLPAICSEPFTPAMAARAGLGRAELDGLVRHGGLRRLGRGVYLDAAVDLTAMLRARAVALRVGRQHIVVDRTAAWIHGAEVASVPLDLHGKRSRLVPAAPLARDEVVVLGGVRCTTPLRTAHDVGRHFSPDRALPLLDGMLRAGAFTHAELLRVGTAAGVRGRGASQFRELVALADARSEDPAESVLRLRWLGGSLPTPRPGVEVAGVRLALALEPQRFGAVLAGQVPTADLGRCAAIGWRVLTLHRSRVLAGDPVHLVDYLEREFHQHLLRSVG